MKKLKEIYAQELEPGSYLVLNEAGMKTYSKEAFDRYIKNLASQGNDVNVYPLDRYPSAGFS
jgi:hypothetical protein